MFAKGLKLIAAAAPMVLGVAANAQLSNVDIFYFEAPPEQPVFARERLARAGPDECYAGIGVDYPPIGPGGDCPAGTPKTNQAYVWGLTQAGVGVPGFAGDALWFGTVANALCLPRGVQLKPAPSETMSWVCEFGESQLAREFAGWPDSFGDWRPPKAYSYDMSAGVLTDRSPQDPTFATSYGIRSAGSIGTVVLMAGPSLLGGAGFFAWEAATGAYLGSCRALQVNNIRSWVRSNGRLYAGIGTQDGRGAVVRWVGTAQDPFVGQQPVSDYCGFEVVAELDGFPAYLTDIEGQRLAVSGWRGIDTTGSPGGGFTRSLRGVGVFVSPPFGPNGVLDPEDGRWKRIWTPWVYEPDPIVAADTAPGALAYWRGQLWWGSFIPAGTAALMHKSALCVLPACHGEPVDQDEDFELFKQTHRAVTVWRAAPGQGASWQVELLYGETELPALVPGTHSFAMQPTGWVPRHGPSGFGNPFLTYTWQAQASSGHLLLGTYDYRYTFDVTFGFLTPDGVVNPPPPLPPAVSGPARGHGADLWRFDDADSPAKPESVHGLGNALAYGVRSMLRMANDRDFVLGTANGMNLEAEGGWELHLLRPSPP